jgi:predicted ribosomally synthesized peptide with nif11-like leader
MALDQLDAFMAHANGDQQLRQQLEQPLDLEAFLALARGAGFNLSEQDVLAAQARADSLLSDSELQRRAGEDARRLRSFIPA